MEIAFYYGRLWESLIYVFVLVSWKFRQLWEYLQQSNPEGSSLTEKTPPNPKNFTPLMRSRRLSSRRTIPGSSSVYNSHKKLSPIPKHLSRNLFDEPDPTISPPPNKDLPATPPEMCDEQSVFRESSPVIPTPPKKLLFEVSSSCDDRSEEEELFFQPIRFIEELSRDL